MPERVQPAWAQAELVGAGRRDAALVADAGGRDRSCDRDPGRSRVTGRNGDGVRVKNPSVLVYDIAGRGFTGCAG